MLTIFLKVHNACPDVTRLYTLSGIELSLTIILYSRFAQQEPIWCTSWDTLLVQSPQSLVFPFMSSSSLTGDSVFLICSDPYEFNFHFLNHNLRSQLIFLQTWSPWVDGTGDEVCGEHARKRGELCQRFVCIWNTLVFHKNLPEDISFLFSIIQTWVIKVQTLFSVKLQAQLAGSWEGAAAAPGRAPLHLLLGRRQGQTYLSICPFWYTTALFGPVKVDHQVASTS